MRRLIYSKRQKEITVPEGWEELTAKQFIALAGILHNGEHENIKYDRALLAVCGKSLLRFLFIPLEIRLRCYDHISWIFESQEVTKQLLPVYGGLYGPASDFDNLILAELHHTETAYYNLTKENDAAALDELVAILYREAKPDYDVKRDKDGDVRVPFAYGDIAYHKALVARWPMAVKQAILLWYDGCRQSLVTQYPPAFEGAETSDNYYNGLYGMIRSLSGDKYGDFEKVNHLFIHIAFLEIVESKKEEAELKRKYNL